MNGWTSVTSPYRNRNQICPNVEPQKQMISCSLGLPKFDFLSQPNLSICRDNQISLLIQSPSSLLLFHRNLTQTGNPNSLFKSPLHSLLSFSTMSFKPNNIQFQVSFIQFSLLLVPLHSFYSYLPVLNFNPLMFLLFERNFWSWKVNLKDGFMRLSVDFLVAHISLLLLPFVFFTAV